MSIWSSIGSFAANNSGDLLKTGASLASTAGNIYAAQRSSDAIRGAANEANRLQAEIYQQNRADMAPYRAAGYGALDEQLGLLGLGGSSQEERALANTQEAIGTLRGYLDEGRTTIGDTDVRQQLQRYEGRLPSMFRDAGEARGQRVTNQLRALPGYQFRMNEGIEARDRSAAARGMTLSGAQQKELTQFGQGLADQTYGQQLNRLASLAGTGQTATTNTAQMGANYGAQAGQNALAGGRARASSYGAMARAGNNLLGNLDYIWGGE